MNSEEKTWHLWDLTQETIEAIAREKGLSLEGRDFDEIARQTKKGIDAALDFAWKKQLRMLSEIRRLSRWLMRCSSSSVRRSQRIHQKLFGSFC